MRVTGVSSLIIVDWFKFPGSLDKLKSYSPSLLACGTLGLQASIFILNLFLSTKCLSAANHESLYWLLLLPAVYVALEYSGYKVSLFQ